jgi:hypothetical protein
MHAVDTENAHFSLVRAPADELHKLKTTFNHDHLNAAQLKIMNTNNAKLTQSLDTYMDTSSGKQADWDKVSEQARNTLKFVLPVIQDFRSETGDVVNEASFSALERNMNLKADILINFPQQAPERNDPLLIDFTKRFKSYAKALDAASEALAEFNKKLTES